MSSDSHNVAEFPVGVISATITCQFFPQMRLKLIGKWLCNGEKDGKKTRRELHVSLRTARPPIVVTEGKFPYWLQLLLWYHIIRQVHKKTPSWYSLVSNLFLELHVVTELPAGRVEKYSLHIGCFCISSTELPTCYATSSLNRIKYPNHWDESGTTNQWVVPLSVDYASCYVCYVTLENLNT